VLVDLPGLSANETMNGMLSRFGLGGKSSLHLVSPHIFQKSTCAACWPRMRRKAAQA
jgi:hypothetical protein